MLNRRQQYKVLVDGVEAGQIKNDDTQEFILEQGTHILQCKLNWMSSEAKTFTVNEGANTYLSVSSGLTFIAPLYILMLIGVLFPFFLRMAKSPVPDYVSTLKIVFIFPAILYYILYLTILRKKYLVVGEDKSNPFK